MTKNSNQMLQSFSEKLLLWDRIVLTEKQISGDNCNSSSKRRRDRSSTNRASCIPVQPAAQSMELEYIMSAHDSGHNA